MDYSKILEKADQLITDQEAYNKQIKIKRIKI